LLDRKLALKQLARNMQVILSLLLQLFVIKVLLIMCQSLVLLLFHILKLAVVIDDLVSQEEKRALAAAALISGQLYGVVAGKGPSFLVVSVSELADLDHLADNCLLILLDRFEIALVLHVNDGDVVRALSHLANFLD